jgi:hypothetical protein
MCLWQKGSHDAFKRSFEEVGHNNKLVVFFYVLLWSHHAEGLVNPKVRAQKTRN